MRIGLVCSLLILFTPGVCLCADRGICFDEYFDDATLRIDYFQAGNHSDEIITLDQIYRRETWAGSPEHLIDDLNYGPYSVKIYDIATNTLVFSRGFSCIFAEYRTTNPARSGVMRTYHATALVPFPRRAVLFVVERRDRQNVSSPIFSTKIDPADVNIIKEKPDERDRIHVIVQSGPPQESLDIVFVAEGYTEGQHADFEADAQRFARVLLEAEPFKTYRDRINITGVFRASAESGVDEPDKGVFCGTAVSAAYNALGLDRYLLVDDNKALNDIAGRVPHDTVVVIANSPRYGGGGIYNDYCIFTAGHRTSETIFLHEFGHSFANLADEYFNASVAYDEFFPPGVEPLESNITALLDPSDVKWKDLLSPGIAVPTPWGQEEIEKLRGEKDAQSDKITAKIARLEARNAPEAKKIALHNELIAQNRRVDEQIEAIRRENREKHADTIGVFEGAGYTAKGLYRSGIDTDFVRGGQYNAVSRRAIEKVINHYTSSPSKSSGVSSPAGQGLVHIAYFVPCDRTVLAGYEERLGRVMKEVQRFYGDGMAAAGRAGQVFGLDLDDAGKMRIRVVQGAHPAATYGRDAWDAVRDEVKEALKSTGLDMDHETVVIFQVLLDWNGDKAVEVGPYVGGGNHLSGTAWVYDDMLLDPQNLSSKEPGGFYGGPCSIGKFNSHYIGGVAHELGHAFGLPHACQRKADADRGTALMGHGNHTYGQELRTEGLGTFLTETSAMVLAYTRPFAGDLKGARRSPRCELVELKAAFADGVLVLSGRIEAAPAVHGIAAYNDPARHEGDYDAVGWTCPVDAHGHFRLQIGELEPGAYQLRLLACHINGAKSTFSYDYEADQDGRPPTAVFKVP
ncbi:MAG: hypothetical protein IH624_10825 [Phycisphaerae bacterium]|nr:hypothetical protein [Phycisphaerae bacterium]